MSDKIIIKGAREHNLQNVSLELPKNKLIVFTGVSGSGKSSLAFDTLYAEGQRRYVESLSSYARQFLGIMDKPNVEHIEGLSPAISIDQKSVSKNPRSTVGTITEIYDYMRLLFARIGHPFCPNCGTEISKLSVDEIVIRVLEYIDKELSAAGSQPIKFEVTAPMIRSRKGEYSGLLDNLRQKGFTEVFIDAKKYDVENPPTLSKNTAHNIDCLIESYSLTKKQFRDEVFASNLKSRLTSTVEMAIKLADGLVRIVDATNHQEHLYSEKLSCPNCNLSLPEIEPRLFSFNSPLGACGNCNGLGFKMMIVEDLVVNPRLSISEGGLAPFATIMESDTWHARLVRTVLDDLEINPRIPLEKVADAKIKTLLHGNQKTYKVYGTNRFGRDTVITEMFIGLIPELHRRYTEGQGDYFAYEVEKYMRQEQCEVCRGKRLKPEVLAIRVGGRNIDDLGALTIDKFAAFLAILEKEINAFEWEVGRQIIVEIERRLKFLVDVGLSYLTISRPAHTLSGGESQRIRLASQIGSGLSGVMYVLDEPSIGLHPKDVAALITSLKNLRDIGNTIIVVEHDQESIVASDYVVDFGPKAGQLGGKVIYSGPLSDFKGVTTSLTAQYLYKKRTIPEHRPERDRPASFLTLSGCRQFNLKNISVKLPLSRLICVTGVSGSGKSTLIVETLYQALRYYLTGFHRETIGEFKELTGYHYLDSVYLVDQSPIGRTPRSNSATYIGAFDYIRDLFAQTGASRERGFAKGRFSFNVKGGRCEKCQGGGTIKIEMQFLPDVYINCDVCLGRRYNSQTLEVLFKGKSIYDILEMTIEESLSFFKSHHLIYNKLETLSRVGLSYVKLGQSAPTLSGGEAQRVKLAHELSKRDSGRTIYILDEPTTGLHPYDIEKLLATLYTLVDRGNTVVVIEHNIDVIKNCEYIIDLGPEGGERGGNLVYQGEVAGIKKIANSFTGQYLKKSL